MAKKAAPKSAKKKPAKKVAPKAAKATKHQTPRSQALPGMGNKVHDQILDNLGENLSDIRATAAECRIDDASNLQAALRRMATKGYNSYRAGKIEYLRSPGEEKIRARSLKDQGGMAGTVEETTDALLGSGDADDISATSVE